MLLVSALISLILSCWPKENTWPNSELRDREIESNFFNSIFLFFFDVDHLKNLYWICYNIASLIFWFIGCEAHGILAPWPEFTPTCPALEGKVLTTGLPGVPRVYFLMETDEKPYIYIYLYTYGCKNTCSHFLCSQSMFYYLHSSHREIILTPKLR